MALHAVLIERGVVRWIHHVPRATGELKPLADVLGQLLDTMPPARWAETHVVAAIGPAAAQVRPLTGVPMADVAMLAAIVRAGASRFFLRTGAPIVIGCVERINGQPWGVAIDRSVLESLMAACRQCRLRLDALVPSVRVIQFGFAELPADAIVECRDGDVVAEVRYRDGELAAISRRARGDGAEETRSGPHSMHGSLQAVAGADAAAYGAAFGAATAGAREMLAYAPTDADLGRRGLSARRVRVPIAACLASLLLAAILPVLSLRATGRRATTQLEQLRPAVRAVERERRELRAITDTLVALSTFARERRSMTLALASIALALPESASVLSFQADGDGGTMVITAPRGATPIEELDQVEEITNPTIVGALLPDGAPASSAMPGQLVGPPVATLDRATIRFKWRHPVRPHSSRATTDSRQGR